MVFALKDLTVSWRREKKQVILILKILWLDTGYAGSNHRELDVELVLEEYTEV